jgi:DNA replication and repair protein RecF
MKLEHISVDSVRNLAHVELAPHPRLTVLIGDNGQGKTNLLECVHLASALRPLRSVEKASELVMFGKERGLIKARFELDGPLPIEVLVEPKGRKATVAGKSVRDVGALSWRIGVVSFLPEDSAMIRGGPEQRRRGLDRFAYSILPGFAEVARRFEEALERRNRVLKAPVVDIELLESYDAPFAQAAASLTRARAAAVARWAPAFRTEARAIGGDALDAEMRYAPDIDGMDDANADEAKLIERFLEELGAARGYELKRRSTAKGPHHDDVVLWKAYGAKEKARFLASQGEARALVLAMKIATVRLSTEARGTGPLLLLDDVAGELDPEKGARLFRAVDDTDAQVFVTTTHQAVLPPLGDAKVLTVQAGALVALTP